MLDALTFEALARYARGFRSQFVRSVDFDNGVLGGRPLERRDEDLVDILQR